MTEEGNKRLDDEIVVCAEIQLTSRKEWTCEDSWDCDLIRNIVPPAASLLSRVMYQATDLSLLLLLCQLICPSSSLHKTRSTVRRTRTLEVRETKLGSQGVVVTVENHSQYTLADARAYITGEGREFVQFAPERKVTPGTREEYVFPCQNCLDSSGVLSWTVIFCVISSCHLLTSCRCTLRMPGSRSGRWRRRTWPTDCT